MDLVQKHFAEEYIDSDEDAEDETSVELESDDSRNAQSLQKVCIH
jgi:hypothetical protein